MPSALSIRRLTESEETILRHELVELTFGVTIHVILLLRVKEEMCDQGTSSGLTEPIPEALRAN